MSALSVAGIAPERELTPADRSELAAIVRECYADGRTFAFAGGGSEIELGNAPRALHALVRTIALDGVLDYSPEDQTITVEAGMTLAALDRVLAEHGQLLPIDVADRERSTIGGAIATNAFGARRHRYGSIKDLIVGIEIVRPDGTVARSGGKVVKNVAGFDVPKLMVGALGTLGAIVAATFRVFPAAASSAAIVVRGMRDGFVPALFDAQLEPVSITTLARDGACDALIVFEGEPRAVAAQTERASDLGAAFAAAVTAATDTARQAFAERERAVRRGGAWRVRASAPPAGPNGGAAGGWFENAIGYPALGVRLASGADSGASPEAIAAGVGELRAAVSGPLIFHAMPPAWRGRIDAWGEPPPSFALMRALKANFDAKGLCNPGRFVGGL